MSLICQFVWLKFSLLVLRPQCNTEHCSNYVLSTYRTNQVSPEASWDAGVPFIHHAHNYQLFTVLNNIYASTCACIISPALTAVNQKIQKDKNKSASHFNRLVNFMASFEKEKTMSVFRWVVSIKTSQWEYLVN